MTLELSYALSRRVTSHFDCLAIADCGQIASACFGCSGSALATRLLPRVVTSSLKGLQRLPFWAQSILSAGVSLSLSKNGPALASIDHSFPSWDVGARNGQGNY